MTTIAYKNGVIAFDGRMARTDDGTLISDDYLKMIEREGVFFFITGSIAFVDNLLNSYLGKESPNVHSAVNALVVDGEQLFYIGICPEPCYFWKEPISRDMIEAWGSGKDHVLTAFDYGADPIQAVQMAAKRDLFTGGVIRAFDINEKRIITEINREEI